MFVPKKNGKLRLVIDHKQLNEITVKNKTLLLFITEIKKPIIRSQIVYHFRLKGKILLYSDQIKK